MKRFLSQGFVFAFGAALIIVMTGCSRKDDPSEPIIVKVNDDVIYAKDIKRQIALKSRVNPNFKVASDTLRKEIDSLIDQRLLVEEARKLGLDQTPRFSDTIQVYREQTLIRDLIALKSRQLQRLLTVSEDEIQKAYDHLAEGNTPLPDLETLRPNITKQILAVKQTESIRNWIEDLRSAAVIQSDAYAQNLQSILNDS